MAKKAAKPNFIPGTEPEVIDDIDHAAIEYHKAKQSLANAKKRKVERGEALLEAMKKHRKKKYRVHRNGADDLDVNLKCSTEAAETRKVKTATDVD